MALFSCVICLVVNLRLNWLCCTLAGFVNRIVDKHGSLRTKPAGASHNLAELLVGFLVHPHVVDGHLLREGRQGSGETHIIAAYGYVHDDEEGVIVNPLAR